MSDCITIDGAQGEGGGQILRTALGLSLVTGRAVRFERIRARRSKPGLLRQHLTAVQAAAAIGSARIAGAELGSQSLLFEPGAIHGGEYHLAVGTAGSTTLVLQTVLPALALAPEPSVLTLDGGTHNPFAPPFDFLAKSFLPLLARMGPQVEVHLERHGFFPAGGGRLSIRVTPCAALQPIAIEERGEVQVSARALVACLSETIAKRELSIVRERLGLERAQCRVETIDCPVGPGNVVMVTFSGAQVTEVVTGFGEKGVSAEQVANRCAEEALRYRDANVPIGEHLADQLLVPMALAGGGRFRTLSPSSHALTNADVIRRFLNVDVQFEDETDSACRVTVAARGETAP